MATWATHWIGRCLATLALCAVVAVVGCTEGAGGSPLALAATASSTVKDCAEPAGASELRGRLISLVNQERAKYGLEPVVENEALNIIADNYACYLIENDFFAHYDPDTGEGPGERAIRGGYFFFKLGENLAAGQRTPEQAMNDWMVSTNGHRENILNPDWEEIGVGVRLGGDHGIYWVQEFGDPR